jgi:hypothetical protein
MYNDTNWLWKWLDPWENPMRKLGTGTTTT